MQKFHVLQYLISNFCVMDANRQTLNITYHPWQK